MLFVQAVEAEAGPGWKGRLKPDRAEGRSGVPMGELEDRLEAALLRAEAALDLLADLAERHRQLASEVTAALSDLDGLLASDGIQDG
jgi:hypothetical protein